MHGEDLTPALETSLAWYYLLVTVLNIGAAAHWVYWSRGQKLLPFENALVAVFGALYGVLLLGWAIGFPSLVLYAIGTAANGVGLFVVLPASIYQKVRAGTVWCVFAGLFQALGWLYALNVGPAMPLALRDAIDKI